MIDSVGGKITEQTQEIQRNTSIQLPKSPFLQVSSPMFDLFVLQLRSSGETLFVADRKPQKMSGYFKTLYFPRGCLKHLCAVGPRLWVWKTCCGDDEAGVPSCNQTLQAGKSLTNGGFTGQLYKWKIFQPCFIRGFHDVPRESWTVHNGPISMRCPPMSLVSARVILRRRLCLWGQMLPESLFES